MHNDKQDTLTFSALCQYSSNAIWCRMLCGYVDIWGLASPTPLEQLLEDSGSLPASKRVSRTRARLRIEGCGCLSLCTTGWVRYFGLSQKAVNLLANGWHAPRTGVHTFHGGLTQMSLLSQNTVTFSGYTPKHIVSSPLLLCNGTQTHTH